ncbi:MAG: hypothetical protein ACE5JL_19935, partial [Dehalococcoidia bacterium]
MSEVAEDVTKDGRSGWILPEGYMEMTPLEQRLALRSCILKYLNQHGPDDAVSVSRAIRAPAAESVRKNLQLLATTQSIYAEKIGGTTKYYSNGRLAHPLLQGVIKCGRTEYALRTYFDRLTGWSLTITEYQVSGVGQRSPKGGIRLDPVDLQAFIKELQRIEAVLDKNPEVLSRGLVTR